MALSTTFCFSAIFPCNLSCAESRTASSTVELAGSASCWATKAHSLPKDASSLLSPSTNTRPRIWAPPVASKWPRKLLMSMVFPAPEGPMMAVSRPTRHAPAGTSSCGCTSSSRICTCMSAKVTSTPRSERRLASRKASPSTSAIVATRPASRRDKAHPRTDTWPTGRGRRRGGCPRWGGFRRRHVTKRGGAVGDTNAKQSGLRSLSS
mmetsp:Transcript_9696/g.58720  ORF Transcript_9696/g.58720 Transcript_9696/m.58720 type:complete len:208 (+) Transcript_9696:3908-4531(+)